MRLVTVDVPAPKPVPTTASVVLDVAMLSNVVVLSNVAMLLNVAMLSNVEDFVTRTLQEGICFEPFPGKDREWDLMVKFVPVLLYAASGREMNSFSVLFLSFSCPDRNFGGGAAILEDMQTDRQAEID